MEDFERDLVRGDRPRLQVRTAARGVGLTLVLIGALSLLVAGPASAKAPPAHAFYGLSAGDIECYTPDGGATIGAKVDAFLGAQAKKNNAFRRFEIKYRLVYADTTGGLGLAKPGYKVTKSKTQKYSDTTRWKYEKKNLSTNRESAGGDYNVEMEFVWIRGGGRPNWKVKNKLYIFKESTCEGSGGF